MHDGENESKTAAVVLGGEDGLTLGAQSLCAVLCGLAAPLAHLAVVSGRWRVAFPAPLPLTLAAAQGPFAPLVPGSIDYSGRKEGRAVKTLQQIYV